MSSNSLNKARTSHRTGLVVMIAALGLIVGSCSGAVDTVTIVDSARAAELLETEPALVVVDIRTPEEIATGTLPDAVGIDFYSPAFRDELAALDRGTPYLVYCRSGNRSAQAMDVMRDLGFTEVYELGNGIVSWVETGRSLSTG